jgi:hypothetical protein
MQAHVIPPFLTPAHEFPPFWHRHAIPPFSCKNGSGVPPTFSDFECASSRALNHFLGKRLPSPLMTAGQHLHSWIEDSAAFSHHD